MSAQSEGPIRLTLEEYLKFEELSEVKHELVDGQVTAMAGGSERHDIMTMLIAMELGNALRMSRCRVFPHNRKLLTQDGEVYYPDILVRCGPAAHRLYETDATWIVEVLSPSNHPQAVTDRLLAYRALPSVQGIVFVDVVRRTVTAHWRGGDRSWSEEQPAAVEMGPARLDFAKLWEELDLTSSTEA